MKKREQLKIYSRKNNHIHRDKKKKLKGILKRIFSVLVLPVIISSMIPIVTNLIHTLHDDIKINSITVRDAPRIIGDYIVNEADQNNQFSNHIINDVHFSGEKAVTVDSIMIKNVKFSNFEFSDLVAHYGFNDKSQTFDAFIMQNGNKNVDETYHLKISNVNINSKDKEISKYSSNVRLNSGDIRKIFSINLNKDSIFKEMKKQLNQDDLISLDIQNSKGNSKGKKILQYDAKNNKFIFPPTGAASGGGNIDEILLFKINSSKKNYTKIVSETIDKDSRKLSFNLLFNKTAHVDYDIYLSYQMTSIKSKSEENHKSIDIRVPHYIIYGSPISQDNSVYYQFMIKKKLLTATYKQMKIFNPDLLYTVEDTEKLFRVRK
ncbi:hypothetical protein [Streptococcus pluranimalium]|uniref:Uncharacterized protein n=1 Tax=Streptococcus pluranimalium TaxID=82348 RepID=A0A2L0D307_9STRE|nr:hypothetical protein [Streptococcus pluranimalium]AUW96020.1 hypothetical protein C0J00_02195 [Streptococcus pluranimalium]